LCYNPFTKHKYKGGISVLNALWQTINNFGFDFDAIKSAIDDLFNGENNFFSSLISTITGIFG